MTTTTCPDCRAPCIWDEDVCSSVCIACGTLADSSQCLLSSQAEYHESLASHSSAAAPFKGTNSHAWNLPGQHRQARARNNSIAMDIFINSVLTKLKHPGLSPRAQAIFAQVMAKGKYRWGRKAKLAAGASIAVALREAHKSDSLRDIAFFLDDSHLSLSRTFVAVVSLLDFQLDPSDPVLHLPILLAHLQSLLHPESPSASSHLPLDLVAILTPLSFHSVLRTATSLSGIFSQRACAISALNSPTPAVACAIFILALEAETRSPLPHLAVLAKALAARFGFAHGVVTSRYKICYDLIEEWIRRVPWLEHFVYKGKGHGPCARSRVPKRSIVAKGIMDAIQFQEEIWMEAMNSLGKVAVVIDPDLADGDRREDDQPRKKRWTTTEDAYHFLLDPLAAKSYSLSMPMLSDDLLNPDGVGFTPRSKRPPSRLQLLALSRGGGTPEHIGDDELFADGELEELLRTEEEQEALKPLFRLQWEEVVDTMTDQDHGEHARAEVRRGSGRVNMEVLANIVGDDGEAEPPSRSATVPSDAAEEMCAWRPVSPGTSYNSLDRYEEEY